MEFAVPIDLTTATPITEGQIIDLDELGAVADGDPGELTTSVTMTADAADPMTAGDVAARQMCMVLHGATVDGLNVITTAEQNRRLREKTPPASHHLGMMMRMTSAIGFRYVLERAIGISDGHDPRRNLDRPGDAGQVMSLRIYKDQTSLWAQALDPTRVAMTWSGGRGFVGVRIAWNQVDSDLEGPHLGDGVDAPPAHQ